MTVSGRVVVEKTISASQLITGSLFYQNRRIYLSLRETFSNSHQRLFRARMSPIGGSLQCEHWNIRSVKSPPAQPYSPSDLSSAIFSHRRHLLSVFFWFCLLFYFNQNSVIEGIKMMS